MSDVNEMVRLSTEPHGVLPRRVCWIGGGSAAGGRSSLAASRFRIGMRVYATDNVSTPLLNLNRNNCREAGRRRA